MKIRGTGADNTPVGELNLLNLKKNRAQAGQILMIPFHKQKPSLAQKEHSYILVQPMTSGDHYC